MYSTILERVPTVYTFTLRPVRPGTRPGHMPLPAGGGGYHQSNIKPPTAKEFGRLMSRERGPHETATVAWSSLPSSSSCSSWLLPPPFPYLGARPVRSLSYQFEGLNKFRKWGRSSSDLRQNSRKQTSGPSSPPPSSTPRLEVHYVCKSRHAAPNGERERGGLANLVCVLLSPQVGEASRKAVPGRPRVESPFRRADRPSAPAAAAAAAAPAGWGATRSSRAAVGRPAGWGPLSSLVSLP